MAHKGKEYLAQIVNFIVLPGHSLLYRKFIKRVIRGTGQKSEDILAG